MVFNYAIKTFQVSHWGNIAVTEEYQIENIGAKLIGEFGRFHLFLGDGRMERRLCRIERTGIIDQKINRSARLGKGSKVLHLDEVKGSKEPEGQIIHAVDVAVGVMGRGQWDVGRVQDVLVCGIARGMHHIIGVQGVVHIAVAGENGLLKQETVTHSLRRFCL